MLRYWSGMGVIITPRDWSAGMARKLVPWMVTCWPFVQLSVAAPTSMQPLMRETEKEGAASVGWDSATSHINSNSSCRRGTERSGAQVTIVVAAGSGRQAQDEIRK